MGREIAKKDARKPRNGIGFELLRLVLKLIIAVLIGLIVFGYVFGLTRNLSLNMQPAFQDGDLVVYYRLIQDYKSGDTVVVHYQGRDLTERIIAVAGDTVDITADGLCVNGSYVQEPQVLGDTVLFDEGVSFPLTVGAGEYFVLGDNRESAIDSRVFGCVSKKAVKGRVIGLFRRRNF